MSLLQHVAIFLLAAVIAVPLFRWLGLGSVLGYLAAGIVIGPWGSEARRRRRADDALRRVRRGAAAVRDRPGAAALAPAGRCARRCSGSATRRSSSRPLLLGAVALRARAAVAGGAGRRHSRCRCLRRRCPAAAGRAQAAARPSRPRGLRHPAVPGHRGDADARPPAAARARRRGSRIRRRYGSPRSSVVGVLGASWSSAATSSCARCCASWLAHALARRSPPLRCWS